MLLDFKLRTLNKRAAMMTTLRMMMIMVMMMSGVYSEHEKNMISVRTNMSKDKDKCPSLYIPQGQVSPHKRVYEPGEVVTVRCEGGGGGSRFASRWEHELLCGGDGVWRNADGFPELPRCRYLQCGSPEAIPRGKVQVLESAPLYHGAGGRVKDEGEEDVWFAESSVAKYTCDEGYRLVFPHSFVSPHVSHHLTCKRGEWQGKVPQCVSEGCKSRDPILNGYYLEITGGVREGSRQYQVGATLQFICHTGYALTGPDKYTCTKEGTWRPQKEVPQCNPLQELFESQLCPVPPEVANTEQKLVRGVVTTRGAVEGTQVSYKCLPRYRNTLAPCITHTLTCRGEIWEGTSPECEEFFSCMPPPNINHGMLSDTASAFPVQSQVYYQCESGYKLMGPSVVTCQEDTGCWSPRLPPLCHRLHQFREETLRTDTSILDIHTILVATTGSVIGILLIVLSLILYQRALSPKLVRLRSSSSGGVVVDIPPPPHPRPSSAPPPPHHPPDHDPDRVALIPYPDEQGAPPAYEEAIRHRPPIFEGTGGVGGTGRYTPHPPRSRAHRVGVGGRRTRHRDNADNISYQSVGSARQSSSWSACDSLGSTDTVAATSDSTNITLDTQSSGGVSTCSQAPSCRALAGSLASFDTSSLVNNEGEPLLEEVEGYDGGVEENPHTPHHHPHHHTHHHHHHHYQSDSDSMKDSACVTPTPPPRGAPTTTTTSQE